MTELRLRVQRDYSNPDFPRFLVASSKGPVTPEDYVCQHLVDLGWTPALRTQNDCWEVLACVVAGHLVPVAPREGVYLVVRNLAGVLGADAYASFRQNATTEVQQPGALAAAWSKYREEMRATAGGRRLLDTRAETLDEFVTAWDCPALTDTFIMLPEPPESRSGLAVLLRRPPA